MKPKAVSAAIVLPDGGRQPITLKEFRELERRADQARLENVVVSYADGSKHRPYRFASVDAPTFGDDGTVFL